MVLRVPDPWRHPTPPNLHPTYTSARLVAVVSLIPQPPPLCILDDIERDPFFTLSPDVDIYTSGLSLAVTLNDLPSQHHHLQSRRLFWPLLQFSFRFCCLAPIFLFKDIWIEP